MYTFDEALQTLSALAPLQYAESWDNVGLLVDPPSDSPKTVGRIGLTIDLTDGPFEELMASEVDLIVAYHPPIFSGLKRLSASEPGARRLMRLIQAGVAVYSPHTALDAVPGGLNDWLAEGLGAASNVAPITYAKDPRPEHEYQPVGAGRHVTLAHPMPLADLFEPLKRHLGLDYLRVATPDERALVRTAAVCPGAGGSLFNTLRHPVDLLVTGELRHHDILAHVARGTSVIVTDHTNTERGFLPTFAQQLQARLPEAQVIIAESDRDPLSIV